MRIVQLANFVSPTSGGIRTTMSRLREGYAEAGHETVLVIPGSDHAAEQTEAGLVVQVAAPRIPRSGGYRMIINLRAVMQVLEDLQPDRLEVNDRFTLRAVGDWARSNRVPAVAVVHERLDRLAPMYLPWAVRPPVLARRDNASLGARFDAVVSPSAWGAQEFVWAGVGNIHVVGWGVDLDRFHPDRRSPVLRRRLVDDADVLMVMVCRLSPEKRPESAIDALAVMRQRGINARLVVAGTGKSDRSLRKRAQGLPVHFLGHLEGRDHVAELLAAADVAICPGPIETFGLAALEAMASGTPVVSSVSGAIAELLDEPYGLSAYSHGPAMAGAAIRLLSHGQAARIAARAAAERHPWSRSINRMLDLHGLGAPTRSAPTNDR